MKKNTIAAIVVMCLMLFGCSQTVSAQGIPSSASGVYLAPDKVCRLVLARAAVDYIKADLSCLSYSGAATAASWQLYAPGDSACWPDSVAIPIDPRQIDTTEYVALRGYAGSTLNVLSGGPAAVVNGGGDEQSWTRIVLLPSPYPYVGCSASPPAQTWRDERVCRLTGRLCGN